jgi:hypothetical protein
MRWRPVAVQSERSDGSLVVIVGHQPIESASTLDCRTGDRHGVAPMGR